MARKQKTPMSMDQHIKHGTELKLARQYVMDAYSAARKALPGARCNRAFDKALAGIEGLRIAMDGHMFNVFGDNAPTKAYYGANDETEPTARP